MGIFKRYKKLYETEKENNKLLMIRKRELYNENIKLQKELKKEKENNTKLIFELEDVKAFLEQEKQAKEELLRQKKVEKKGVKKVEKTEKKEKNEKPKRKKVTTDGK